MDTFVVFRPATSVRAIDFPPSWGWNEVLVWPADLDEWAWDGREPDGLLSADERSRAARFVFERDRRRFMTGRAVLRVLLGRCLGRPAAELSFRYGTHGKPGLADGDLWFNASASAGKALFAACPGRRVGVDIERVRDIAAMDAVARRVLSVAERDWLRRCRDVPGESAFFRCWTRKEAVVKGLGWGLSMPLDGLDVEPGRRGPVRVAVSPTRGSRRHWVVQDIPVFRGFVAAVAAEVPGVRHEILNLGEERV